MPSCSTERATSRDGAISASVPKLICAPMPNAQRDASGTCCHNCSSAWSNDAASPAEFRALPSVKTITWSVCPLYPDPNKPAVINSCRTLKRPAWMLLSVCTPGCSRYRIDSNAAAMLSGVRSVCGAVGLNLSTILPVNSNSTVAFVAKVTAAIRMPSCSMLSPSSRTMLAANRASLFTPPGEPPDSGSSIDVDVSMTKTMSAIG